MLKFYLKWKIRRDLRRINRASKFLNLADIRSAVVFFLPEQYDEADAFIQRLRTMGKHVTGWTYFAKKVKDDFSRIKYRVLEQKEDFHWTGEPWEETVNELSEVPCDVMIDLTMEICYPFLYLFSLKESSFKVGIGKGFTPRGLYDLAITRVKKKNISFFANQIIFYLESIQSS